MDGNGLSLPISGLRVSSTDLKTITAGASGRAQRTLGARANWSWLWEAAALLSIEGTVAKRAAGMRRKEAWSRNLCIGTVSTNPLSSSAESSNFGSSVASVLRRR